MPLQFKRATKEKTRLRMAIDGPSGSGKTYTALTFAFALADAVGGKVALIDTEHASASKYADQFPEFDTLEMDTFSPETYTEAIKLAEQAGYSVLVIDSLSHAWDGMGGALELVDKAAARSRSGNSYTAWRDVTPLHRQMVEAILQSSCHIIVTMRSKMEYILQEETRNGRTVQVPKKIGMAPIQRQGTEYEFDIVADIDIDHKLIVSKSRCSAVADAVQLKPKGEWMQPVIDWLTSGIEAKPRESEQAKANESAQPTPPVPKPTRPYDAETVKQGIADRLKKASDEPASTAQRGFIAGTMEQLLSDIQDKDSRKAARYALTNYLVGKTNSGDLTKDECNALSRWMLVKNDEGLDMIDDNAITEAHRILEAVGVDNGQQSMFEPMEMPMDMQNDIDHSVAGQTYRP